jgi:hypothetical protein
MILSINLLRCPEPGVPLVALLHPRNFILQLPELLDKILKICRHPSASRELQNLHPGETEPL